MDFISDARNLNSDLGRHVKKCSFSSSLSGRFYKNSSLENHMASERKVAMMKEKKRQLQKALKMEDKKIKILEEKLKEKEYKRNEEIMLRLQMERAATLLQTSVRRHRAMEMLEMMKIEAEIVRFVVLFCQAAFRGRKGRHKVNGMGRKIMQQRKENYASVRIQTLARKRIARTLLQKRYRTLVLRKEKAATRIQSIERGRSCRYRLIVETNVKIKKKNAATLIQSRFRGVRGRRIVREKRDKKKFMLQTKLENDDDSACSSRKQDRIPIHERRYSSYSVGPERRGSLSSKSSKLKRNIISLSRGEEETTPRFHNGDRKIFTTGEEIADPDRNKRNSHRRHSIDATFNRNRTEADDVTTDHNKTKNTPEKVALARQKAAARVAEVERKARIAEMKKIETAIAASERKAALEEKRRELMRIEQKKRQELQKQKQQQQPPQPDDANEENARTKVKVSLNNPKGDKKSHVMNEERSPAKVQNTNNIDVDLNSTENDESKTNNETHTYGTNTATISNEEGKSSFVPVFDTTFEDDFSENEDDLS
uniref:Uncharacterized protein n=2 Tax=Ditylum brightwellii TaxID=49249 RepID=A0A7S4QEI3_9STRA|mmetsp:Transcript_33199/g.44068  ORF Transcript_33199/g.44068 Transcript_33199/m.44068 type:complete len:540 (-) Transcript_33199:23-1642(-)